MVRPGGVEPPTCGSEVAIALEEYPACLLAEFQNGLFVWRIKVSADIRVNIVAFRKFK